MKRKGFTLAEMTIAVVIGALFFGGVYMVYQSGIRSLKSSTNKSESLATSYILYQSLLMDCQKMVIRGNTPVEIASVGDGKNNSLSFFTVLEDDTSFQVPVSKVDYLFNTEDQTIYRNGKVVTQGQFENVEFILDYSDSTDAANTLIFKMTAIGRHTSKEMASGAEKERDPFKRMTLIGEVSLKQKSEQDAFPLWQPTYSSYASIK